MRELMLFLSIETPAIIVGSLLRRTRPAD